MVRALKDICLGKLRDMHVHRARFIDRDLHTRKVTVNLLLELLARREGWQGAAAVGGGEDHHTTRQGEEGLAFAPPPRLIGSSSWWACPSFFGGRKGKEEQGVGFGLVARLALR